MNIITARTAKVKPLRRHPLSFIRVNGLNAENYAESFAENGVPCYMW